MKYIDDFRQREIAQALVREIFRLCDRPIRLMEICGTHTMAIFKHGIRSLLPREIELISGPGCPVCVTATRDIDLLLAISEIKGNILTTFGDMIRVPGSKGTLRDSMALGADVRIVYSSLDALRIAQEEKNRDVIFIGIGFETTAPTVAATALVAREKGIKNLRILSLHKLLPPALEALFLGDNLRVDGLICPGHVSTIIGAAPFRPIAKERALPCVITGFEPVDILEGILMLLIQIKKGSAEVEIQYRRAVKEEGNPKALALMEQVFEPCDSHWRGLGLIPKSGLGLRPEFEDLDALKYFSIDVKEASEPKGCKCGEVLKGLIRPDHCPLFLKVCNPENPIGPCMVSSEGSCAAYYRYSSYETP